MSTTARARPLPRLLIGLLLLGMAESMAGPFFVLFGAQRARLSPLAIGTLMSLMAVSGMTVSTWLGRRYDHAPSRTPALLATTASAIGYLLLSITTSYALLLVIAAVFLGTGTAAFPQLFAMARTYLADGTAAALRGTPALRSMWSLAWAIGPAAGAAVLAWRGFTGLFLAAAVGFGLVAVPVLLLGPPAGDAQASRRPPSAEPTRSTRPLLPAVIGFALFHTAMFSGSVALPLYVTEALGRPNHDVGLLFSACAVVEILAALSLTLLPAHLARTHLIKLGMALFVGYFALTAASTNMPLLLTAQVARGVAIATVGALGITHFQELLPDQAGRATTLFSNTATAGSMVAGIVAGASAQALGYRWALLLCGVLSAVAWALLTDRQRATRLGRLPRPLTRR